MISFIQGKIINKTENSLTILTNGWVGYEVNLQSSKLALLKVGEDTGLHTYMSVRENAMELFGFETMPEKELFLKFLSVSGVGPKTALHLISLGTVEEISGAIGRGDVTYLTKVSGIGKKTAERIVVELKSKMNSGLADSGVSSGVLGDVVEALSGLGYSKEEAREAVKSLKTEDKTSEQLMREALKSLGK
jgi:Holliday junction DNA helicase RuvA